MKPPNQLPKWLCHFALPPAINQSSCCSTFLPAFGIVRALDFGHSVCSSISFFFFLICFPWRHIRASQVAQWFKKILRMKKTKVWSLGEEDALEEEMATHSSILAWRIPTDRGSWQATVHGVAKSRTWLSHRASTKTWNVDHLFTYLFAICISSLARCLLRSFTSPCSSELSWLFLTSCSSIWF